MKRSNSIFPPLSDDESDNDTKDAPRLASSTVRDLQVDDLGRSEELKVMSQWVDKKIVEWIKVFAPPSAYEEAKFLSSTFHLRVIIQ